MKGMGIWREKRQRWRGSKLRMKKGGESKKKVLKDRFLGGKEEGGFP